MNLRFNLRNPGFKYYEAFNSSLQVKIEKIEQEIRENSKPEKFVNTAKMIRKKEFMNSQEFLDRYVFQKKLTTTQMKNLLQVKSNDLEPTKKSQINYFLKQSNQHDKTNKFNYNDKIPQFSQIVNKTNYIHTSRNYNFIKRRRKSGTKASEKHKELKKGANL